MRRTYGAPWLVATHAMHIPVSADAYTKGLSRHRLDNIAQTQRRSSISNSSETREKADDQVDRCSRLCFNHRNVGVGHVASAASSDRRHDRDHGSRRRMRSRQVTGSRCLRGQNHQAPSSSRSSSRNPQGLKRHRMI
jgi:hypothetical protein